MNKYCLTSPTMHYRQLLHCSSVICGHVLDIHAQLRHTKKKKKQKNKTKNNNSTLGDACLFAFRTRFDAAWDSWSHPQEREKQKISPIYVLDSNPTSLLIQWCTYIDQIIYPILAISNPSSPINKKKIHLYDRISNIQHGRHAIYVLQKNT